MLIVKKRDRLIQLLKKQKGGNTIGFVPTMGALHEGHASLVRHAAQNNTICICSIFVNPSQFNQKEDFEKYPITLESDIDIVQKNECDILFLPQTDEMYPNGWQHAEKPDLGRITTLWEGQFRPGHFDGVIQVVKLFLDIIQPNVLYLGQKDYQQCAVIQSMIRYYKLPVKIEIRNTLREENGLAMSSRNRRLTPDQRNNAAGIFKALQFINENFYKDKNSVLLQKATQILTNIPESRIEYIAIVDRIHLQALSDDEKNNAVVLVACWVGPVRLIDNLLLN